MTNRDFAVYNYLNSIGIKHSNVGFKYLIDAICFMVEDPIENDKINVVYNKIAQKYGTSAVCVERSIRYLVRPKNSNKEFIVKASHDIIYCSGVTA